MRDELVTQVHRSKDVSQTINSDQADEALKKQADEALKKLIHRSKDVSQTINSVQANEALTKLMERLAVTFDGSVAAEFLEDLERPRHEPGEHLLFQERWGIRIRRALGGYIREILAQGHDTRDMLRVMLPYVEEMARTNPSSSEEPGGQWVSGGGDDLVEDWLKNAVEVRGGIYADQIMAGFLEQMLNIGIETYDIRPQADGGTLKADVTMLSAYPERCIVLYNHDNDHFEARHLLGKTSARGYHCLFHAVLATLEEAAYPEKNHRAIHSKAKTVDGTPSANLKQASEVKPSKKRSSVVSRLLQRLSKKRCCKPVFIDFDDAESGVACDGGGVGSAASLHEKEDEEIRRALDLSLAEAKEQLPSDAKALYVMLCDRAASCKDDLDLALALSASETSSSADVSSGDSGCESDLAQASVASIADHQQEELQRREMAEKESDDLQQALVRSSEEPGEATDDYFGDSECESGSSEVIEARVEDNQQREWQGYDEEEESDVERALALSALEAEEQKKAEAEREEELSRVVAISLDEQYKHEADRANRVSAMDEELARSMALDDSNRGVVPSIQSIPLRYMFIPSAAMNFASEDNSHKSLSPSAQSTDSEDDSLYSPSPTLDLD